MLYDLLHPKYLVSPDGRTALIEARFRDTLGFISACRKVERELRTHRYEQIRRPQGYHIAVKLPPAAIISFLKSPWRRFRRNKQKDVIAQTDYHENFCIHDTEKRLIVGIAALHGDTRTEIVDLRVFAATESYRQHPENAFRLLASEASENYAAKTVEIVTDRPQALSRYGFVAKDGKPFRRNAPNWMAAPIEALLTPRP